MLSVLSVAYPFAPVGPDAVGGAEQVLSAVEAGIARAGLRSLVLACEGSEARGQLFTVPLPGFPLTSERKAEAHRFYRAQIERIVAREQVALLHFHGVDFHAYLPSVPTPALVTLHLPPAWYPADVLRAPRPHTYFNCVSHSQQKACPGCPTLLSVVPNGVNLAALRASPTRADYALVLGRICPEKGIHLALEAAHRADVDLLIAGHVFPYPEHQRYFEEDIVPRLDARRRFLGALGFTEKIAHLARARCLLLPSLVPETSSLVAMEALGCGTPVVAFPIGALRELVLHGETGFLVENVAEMARAITQAADLSPEACRAAAEPFSASAMCTRYLELYRRILTPKAARAREQVSVQVLTELGELQGLAEDWHSLWQRCPQASVFQTPTWLLSWCTHLMQGTPRVVAIRRGGRLIGLAPFFVWCDARRRVLSLMGAGVSDYLDVLAEPEQRLVVLEALEQWLGERDAWDDCEWSELPSGALLLEVSLGSSAATTCEQDVCLGLSLSGKGAPEQVVGARRWGKIAYARRHAAREGELRVEAAEKHTLDALLDRLAELHGARWAARQGSVLDAAGTRAFLRSVAHKLLECGMLMLCGLRMGGEIAAVMYGFHDREATRYYLTAYDSQRASFSPGTLILAHALELALARGAALLDLMRGDEAYKRAWGAVETTRLYRRTTRG